MTRTLTRGLIAGAAGTTVLDAIGYLDMTVRGRPASSLPARTVVALADAAGLPVQGLLQGKGQARESRETALGALGGIGAGLAVGVVASVARSWGFRPSRLVGAMAVGAAAMAAADVPAVATGQTDAHTWTAGDWLSDALPHLGYGLAVDAVLRRDPTPDIAFPVRAGGTLVLRCALLGVAAGSRSSLGVAGPVVATVPGAGLPWALTGRVAEGLAALAVAGELVGDKLPQTPSRLEPPVLAGRLVSGAVGAVALARREEAHPLVPMLAGVAGAAAGSFGGFAWRGWADRRVPDWQAALVEDVAAVLLTVLATVPGRWGAVRAEAPLRRTRRGRRAVQAVQQAVVEAAEQPEGASKRPRYRSSPGTFPGLRPYRPSSRRERRRNP